MTGVFEYEHVGLKALVGDFDGRHGFSGCASGLYLGTHPFGQVALSQQYCGFWRLTDSAAAILAIRRRAIGREVISRAVLSKPARRRSAGPDKSWQRRAVERHLRAG